MLLSWTSTITQEIQIFYERWRNEIAVILWNCSTLQYCMLLFCYFWKGMYLIYLIFSVNTLATIPSGLKLKEESRFGFY